MGKSSLMRKMERTLQSRSDVETVWFNAWTVEGNSVLEGLIKSVLDKIDANILRRTMRRKHLMSVVRVVVSIIVGILRLGNMVDTIWERISVDPRARNQMRDLMVHAMDEWMTRGGRRKVRRHAASVGRPPHQRRRSAWRREDKVLPRPAFGAILAATPAAWIWGAGRTGGDAMASVRASSVAEGRDQAPPLTALVPSGPCPRTRALTSG